MKIHLYAICWNEEVLLPYFFKHYDFVDKFFIFDNESTDNTQKIISSHSNAHMTTYKTDNTIRDDIYLDIKNNAWKNSIGSCDYVIVCDLDEFLYHPNLREFLEKDTKSTLVHAKGFNMIGTNSSLDPSKKLTEQIQEGVDNSWEDKTILFNPNKIQEINYSHGAHSISPLGDIRYSDEELKLLHYRVLNWDYYIKKVTDCKNRLSAKNKETGWGNHFSIPEEEYKALFARWIQEKKKVI